jgi:CTD small phosphatase-like protein 2
VNNDFVKDISRLGRDLTRIMIIDNMPQNFRLQKENGIFIKTFYGEDQEDTALFELIPILTHIAEQGADVTKTLVKFKDDILNKVSSNLGKQQIMDK